MINGAPSPDGFSGHFFKKYCDIAKADVLQATTQFFQ